MEVAVNVHRLLSCKRYLIFAPFNLSSSSSHTIKFPNFRLKPNLGFLRGFRCSRVMSSSSSTSPIKVKEKIDLTEKENVIFQRLLQVLTHFNLQTQLRVAGGWVRDKLLGKECYDIDIALDNMLGREFCEKVNEFLIQNGEETHGIGVIQCNPDQSKHLETARMRLYDIWIDFVNLRSENYSENSRIPTMKFGTAEEDAYRRDLTINSLFYNINTSSVEDLTGRGVADLKSGQIVTPLPPKETFLDDPLRVLRAIRFGARFGFVLDKDLKEAASSDEVKVAIGDKISRERIGHEIDLMISGNEPVKAMTYICDLQLFWVVFNLPSESLAVQLEGRDRHCIACMDVAHSLLQVVGFSNFSDDQRRLYFYGALFLPLRKSVYADKKNKKVPIVNHIFRNSLKLKASDAETVMKLHVASEGFLSLISSITSDEFEHVKEYSGSKKFHAPDTSRQRIVAGKLLREIKSFWRVSLMISTLIDPGDSDHNDAFLMASPELEKRRQIYERVERAIMELGLDSVWDMKPLVNGKEIMNILQLETGGPQVRIWQERLLEWQLAHPSGTAAECIEWMMQELEDQSHSKRAKLEETSKLNDHENAEKMSTNCGT